MIHRLRLLSWQALTALIVFMTAMPAVADDWPQWMGPQRDGIYRETGIVARIPEEGLPVRWRQPVRYGYAGPAVAEGRVYLFDYDIKSGKVENLPSRRDELSGDERLTCFNATSGKLLWRKASPRRYKVSYGGGPRCTPTVDGDLVYTLGAEGDLECRQVGNGELVWAKNFKAAYGVETPVWGHSAHPLVVGDLLCCVAGGYGSVAVAYDKLTGEERWRALSANEPGYCPPTLIKHAGIDQLLIWHPESINSLNPQTGEVYWSLELRPSYGMSVMAPQKRGNLLFASAIGSVSALMKLDDQKPAAEFVWRDIGPKSSVYCANSTPHMEEGVLYGVDCEKSTLVAVDLENGKRLWQTLDPTLGPEGSRRDRHGTAFLIKHEPTGNYFLFSETGHLILAHLTPDGYQELGRTKILEPTSSTFGRPVVWSYPAFANRSVYARNDEELVCIGLTE